MTGIQDWDRVSLPALAEIVDDEEARATASELSARVAIDQFDEHMARVWIKDAVSRGLIRRSVGRRRDETYELTRKGESRLREG